MISSLKSLIIREIKQKKEIKVADIVKATGFSRAYVHRFFNTLTYEGKIILLGKANKAHYVLAGNAKKIVQHSVKEIRHMLTNKALSEDTVFEALKRETGIFAGLKKNVHAILEYAFTEMLNNAIEHSRSKKIEIRMMRERDSVLFEVRDWGIGIFYNIQKKRKLKNELEAIQDLLKGKQTTAPKEHTGEGIFFTSKAGDMLVIQSATKKLIFDTVLHDVFIQDLKHTKGTKVIFRIAHHSKKNLSRIFRTYTDRGFSFNKTNVRVSLYSIDTVFISRSQARRIMSGLDSFVTILLDFKKVDTVGQAFADEIFRVWHRDHPKSTILFQHANENIAFMIRRSQKGVI